MPCSRRCANVRPELTTRAQALAGRIELHRERIAAERPTNEFGQRIDKPDLQAIQTWLQRGGYRYGRFRGNSTAPFGEAVRATADPSGPADADRGGRLSGAYRR